MELAPPPLRVRFADDAKTALAFEWRDGHVSTFPLAYLRGWCPCAPCQGHSAAPRWVEGGSSKLAGMSTVGAYALQLQWDDGHSTGIYTWEWLRLHCPCDACVRATR